MRCWDIHNPLEATYKGAVTEEEMLERIKAKHREQQDLLTVCPDCGKYTRDMTEHRSYRCKVAQEQRKESRDPDIESAS